MAEILQTHLPEDMRVLRRLPGVQPELGSWLRVDEVYGAQVRRRMELLRVARDDVIYLDPEARPAAEELLDAVLAESPAIGFRVGTSVQCPDGRQVRVDLADPLGTLGQLCQSDFVIMEKRNDQHVLAGAVLCFPASWRLSEKAGRPLTDIHTPVEEYNADVARRVQRLFDGLQVGRPVWRFNQLWYHDAELFQPRSSLAPQRVGVGGKTGPYLRSERQTLVRLPRTRAVVFVIHTYVLARADVIAHDD